MVQNHKQILKDYKQILRKSNNETSKKRLRILITIETLLKKRYPGKKQNTIIDKFISDLITDPEFDPEQRIKVLIEEINGVLP